MQLSHKTDAMHMAGRVYSQNAYNCLSLHGQQCTRLAGRTHDQMVTD